MAQDKKSFILYADQRGVFNQLPDELAGKLIKHIFAYVSDENPQSEDLIINIAFEPIKQSLKRDLQRWQQYIDKQADNGKKGGRPKKANETQKTQAFLEKPKKADSVSVSVNVSDNVNDKTKLEGETPKPVKKFIVPSITEIQTEFAEIDAERFYNYYQAKGWMIGSNKMKDWKAAARNWIARDKPKETKQPFQLRNVATLDDD